MKPCAFFFIAAIAIAFVAFTPQPVRAQDEVFDMVSSLLDGIFGSVSKTISSGGDVISTVLAQIVKQGVKIIQGGSAPSSGVVHASTASGVMKILNSVATGVTDIINSSVTAISDGISKLIDAASSGSAGNTDRMSGHLNTLSTILTDVVNPLTTIDSVQNSGFDNVLASFRLTLVNILSQVPEPLCQLKNNQTFGPISIGASLVLNELGKTIKALELSSCSLQTCRFLSIAVNQTLVQTQC